MMLKSLQGMGYHKAAGALEEESGFKLADEGVDNFLQVSPLRW